MFDTEIFDLINKETKRQRDGLELIPSENYVSREVLEAMGSIFTNKYSEGYPGKRYYGGQEFTDQVETLAIERAKKLFGATTPTSSRTLVRRPTWRSTTRGWSRATRFSAWISGTADI